MSKFASLKNIATIPFRGLAVFRNDKGLVKLHVFFLRLVQLSKFSFGSERSSREGARMQLLDRINL